MSILDDQEVLKDDAIRTIEIEQLVNNIHKSVKASRKKYVNVFLITSKGSTRYRLDMDIYIKVFKDSVFKRPDSFYKDTVRERLNNLLEMHAAANHITVSEISLSKHFS